jgi:hypothetical protein
VSRCAACIIFNNKTGRVDWLCFSSQSVDFEIDDISYASSDPFTPLLSGDLPWAQLFDCLPHSCAEVTGKCFRAELRARRMLD